MKWPILPLGQVAEIVGGSTPRRDRPECWGGTIPWVTPTDLPMPGHGIAKIKTTAECISDEGLKSSSTHMLPVGAVLFSSRATIGKLGIAQIPLATNQGFSNFIPKTFVDGKYLAYCLQYNTDHITALAGSTTFKEVTKSALKQYRIPVPPISEQRRIVEFLDQASAIQKKRAEADVKALRILPALFYKMFGDPAAKKLKWNVTSLGRAGADVRYGLGQPPALSSTGIPMIRATNIHHGRITDLDMIRVDPNEVPKDRNAFLAADEVLVVRSGAYTGDVAQVTEKWAGSVAGYDLIVSPGAEFCGEYIEAYLLTPHVQKNHFGRLKARAGQPHLNAAQLLETPILHPPKPLQLAFAKSVRFIRDLSQDLQVASSALDRLFNELMHRAFSGDLTSTWREAHLMELLVEMEEQEKVLSRSC